MSTSSLQEDKPVATKQKMQQPKPSFFKKHGSKLIALSLWALLLGWYTWYYNTNNLTPAKALAEIADLLNSPYGPLIYIGIYAIRPLFFISAAALTIASGAIFGAGSPQSLLFAVLLTIVASNISSTVAYFVGRFFGAGVLENSDGNSGSIVQKYTDRMRDNSFETVLIMRFIFLPYDMVSYLAGILHIKYFPFILATALGSIPGTIAFVSFGASIDITDLLAGETPEFDPWVLAFGVVIFVVSIVISRIFKKREAKKETKMQDVESEVKV